MNFINSSNPNRNQNQNRQNNVPRMQSSCLRYMKGSPAAKARDILRELSIQDLPIDPRHIAAELGIVIWESELPETCDGILMQVENAWGILVNTRIRFKTRQNFTIAHEIGHYMLERNTARSYSLDEQLNAMRAMTQECDTEEGRLQKKTYLLSEQRANLFAVELLMPSPIFLADAASLQQVGLPAIAELASQYGTSLTSTAIRYTRLSDHVCAIVFSENGIIRYFAYSNGFRKNENCYIVNGKPLHPDALASRCSNGSRVSEIIDDVPLNYWSKPKNQQLNKETDCRIIEHSRRLPRTNQVITFLHLP